MPVLDFLEGVTLNSPVNDSHFSAGFAASGHDYGSGSSSSSSSSSSAAKAQGSKMTLSSKEFSQTIESVTGVMKKSTIELMKDPGQESKMTKSDQSLGNDKTLVQLISKVSPRHLESEEMQDQSA